MVIITIIIVNIPFYININIKRD